MILTHGSVQVNLAMKSQIEKLQSQLLEVQEKIKAEEEGKGDEEEVDEDGLDGEEAEEHGDEVCIFLSNSALQCCARCSLNKSSLT